MSPGDSPSNALPASEELPRLQAAYRDLLSEHGAVKHKLAGERATAQALRLTVDELKLQLHKMDTTIKRLLQRLGGEA